MTAMSFNEKKEITSTPTYQATGVAFIFEYLKKTSELMVKSSLCFKEDNLNPRLDSNERLNINLTLIPSYQ